MELNNKRTAPRLTRSAEIYQTLKQRIIHWEYAPGHRLTEELLCQEFGVSRIPVREALQLLEEQQLVDRTPHRGCAVKQLDLDEIHELYDVRLALESYVVEQLATAGMPAGQWTELAHKWRSLGELQLWSAVDSEVLAHEDERFHLTLARATGNRMLSDLVHSLNERLFFVRLADITTSERLQATSTQHLEILTAIQRGDAAGAVAAMRANIAFGRGNVESVLREVLARLYLQPKTAVESIQTRSD